MFFIPVNLDARLGTHPADDPVKIACFRLAVISGDPRMRELASEIIDAREAHERAAYYRGVRKIHFTPSSEDT
jgi:hypothetical protein